jgi:hypothetical protein
MLLIIAAAGPFVMVNESFLASAGDGFMLWSPGGTPGYCHGVQGAAEP